ncbi:MAG: S-layer homology domain-containing protein [Clostridia bacterium]|nr:S-layer homology domain-containing protein [Clostridia bacterium]
MSRYLEFKGKTLKTDALTYTDSAKIDGWAKDFVNKAGNAGIITGVGTEFQPKSNATRAQAATILQRIVAYLD